MRRLTLPAIAALVGLAMTAAPGTSQTATDGSLVPVPNASLDWAPIAPPGFDEGMEIAGIHGDPAAAGPYTLRLRFEDGYRFPPHFHPNAENLTVLEGTFLLAMGEESDETRLKEYVPGDYLFIEPEHPHFGGARGATTIQLHGVGPFDIIVVGSPEDKRGK